MFKNAPNSSSYIPVISRECYPEAQIPYSADGTNQIRWLLPTYLGFISATDSKIQYELTMQGRGMPIPSPRAGCHSLIRDVRIQSGDAQATLEEILDYNVLTATWWGYSENQSIADKRTMFEGRDANPSVETSLYYNGSADWHAEEITMATRMKPATIKIQQPLYSGVMNSDKVFPVSATQGLRLHLNLERNERALVYKQGARGASTPNTAEGLASDNNIRLKVTLPAGAGAKADVGTTYNVDITNETVSFTASGPNNNNPFSIGDLLSVKAADGSDPQNLGIVSTMTTDGAGGLRLGMIHNQPAPFPTAGLAVEAVAGSIVYYTNETRMNGWSPANVPAELMPLAQEKVGYTMTNMVYLVGAVSPPELYVKAMMDQMSSSKGLALDISTYSLYRNTLTATVGLTNSLIPATQTRAYSCLSVPLSNEAQIDMLADSLAGVVDNANSYQYVHKNRLIPDRPVTLRKTSQNFCDQLALLELEKALVNCNVATRNLQRIPERFVIGRAFSKYGQVADLENGTLTLRVEYSNLATIQKILNHYICHLSRITISQGNVTVS